MKIICPKCGELKQYGQKEVVERVLLFDAKGEPLGSTDNIGIRTGKPRCLICNHLVKLYKKSRE